jgi:hypothetical protein
MTPVRRSSTERDMFPGRAVSGAFRTGRSRTLAVLTTCAGAL